MSVVYSQTAINNRLQGVVNTIDASGAGNMVVKQGATTLATIVLSVPSGTISGGVLTFTVPANVTASNSGTANTVIITDNTGATVISGMTVGIPTSGAEVIISNGLNSLAITAGQSVGLVSAQITGS